jgi:hypothetical protein
MGLSANSVGRLLVTAAAAQALESIIVGGGGAVGLAAVRRLERRLGE